MFKELRSAILLFAVMTLLTGVAYPLVVTFLAQYAFSHEANGSLIRQNGKIVGSELIGQNFDDPKYFWGRLSATAPAYNAAASSGSNLGPMNPALKDAAAARVKALKDADPSNTTLIPVDLVTTSGSGLDPHISMAAARYQAPRIARVRNIEETELNRIIDFISEEPQWGIFGETRVNVLKLNLLLDEWQKNPGLALHKSPEDHLPKNMKWGNWENPRNLK